MSVNEVVTLLSVFTIFISMLFYMFWQMDMTLYRAMKEEGRDVAKPKFFGSWFAS